MMVSGKGGGENNEGYAHRERHERFPRKAGELQEAELDEDRSQAQAVFFERPEVTDEAEPLEHRMECAACGFEFDPIRYRWLCPQCKHKNSCCEGVPLHAGEEQHSAQEAEGQG